MTDDVRWDPPGPGGWWLELAHFPRPVSRLFADLFPPATAGWARGSVRYGGPNRDSRWAHVNGWLYYGSDLGEAPAGDPAEAARAREEARWREETRRWHEEERPALVATNLGLQDEDVATMDDVALRDHVARAVDQYRAAAPLHFEHQGDHAVNAVLREEATAAGFGDLELAPLLAGSSPASRRPAELVAAVAHALRGAGIDDVASLDDVRAVPAADAALDAYLREYGHRLVESYDLLCPTLLERPELIVAALRAGLRRSWRSEAAAPAAPPWRDPSREGADGVDPAVAARLDELLADACAAYALRDDDDGTCFFWPLGLVRRAALEGGRRLVAGGRIDDAADVFECTAAELLDLLDGAGPSGPELAARTATRVAAGALVPPSPLHEPPATATAAVAGHDLRGTGIGTGRARGRALVHRTGDDALTAVEPGDVLVTLTTTPAFNTVFPLLGAVVTQEGGTGSHAALVARELGIPAVVGVPGLLDAVSGLPPGTLLDVDAGAGTIRPVESL